MSEGSEYLTKHPMEDGDDCAVFLDDALHALHIAKSLAQNGFAAGPFLEGIVPEMRRAKDELSSRDG